MIPLGYRHQFFGNLLVLPCLGFQLYSQISLPHGSKAVWPFTHTLHRPDLRSSSVQAFFLKVLDIDFDCSDLNACQLLEPIKRCYGGEKEQPQSYLMSYPFCDRRGLVFLNHTNYRKRGKEWILGGEPMCQMVSS